MGSLPQSLVNFWREFRQRTRRSKADQVTLRLPKRGGQNPVSSRNKLSANRGLYHSADVVRIRVLFFSVHFRLTLTNHEHKWLKLCEIHVSLNVVYAVISMCRSQVSQEELLRLSPHTNVVVDKTGSFDFLSPEKTTRKARNLKICVFYEASVSLDCNGVLFFQRQIEATSQKSNPKSELLRTRTSFPMTQG